MISNPHNGQLIIIRLLIAPVSSIIWPPIPDDADLSSERLNQGPPSASPDASPAIINAFAILCIFDRYTIKKDFMIYGAFDNLFLLNNQAAMRLRRFPQNHARRIAQLFLAPM